MIRLRNSVLLCMTWGLLATPASHARSLAVLPADIEPQPVAQALEAFADQTGLQLIYVSEVIGTQQSKGARAGLPLREALTQLLDGTGLRFEFLNDRAVRILAAPAIEPAAAIVVQIRNADPGHAFSVSGQARRDHRVRHAT